MCSARQKAFDLPHEVRGLGGRAGRRLLMRAPKDEGPSGGALGLQRSNGTGSGNSLAEAERKRFEHLRSLLGLRGVFLQVTAPPTDRHAACFESMSSLGDAPNRRLI